MSRYKCTTSPEMREQSLKLNVMLSKSVPNRGIVFVVPPYALVPNITRFNEAFTSRNPRQ